jgi:hypothetical protein
VLRRLKKLIESRPVAAIDYLFGAPAEVNASRNVTLYQSAFTVSKSVTVILYAQLVCMAKADRNPPK